MSEFDRPFQGVDQEVADQIWGSWVEPYVWSEEAKIWLRERPPEIVEMMLKFPPDAKVKGTRPLDCPKPWEVAIVVSHFDSGLVSVAVPGRPLKAQCEQDWLRVIDYRKGMTPDDIRRILEGA